MAKRKPRALLKATALAAGTMLAGCGSQASDEQVQPPGNPKGSGYDDETVQTDMSQNEAVETETDPTETETVESEEPDAGSPPDMEPLPLPANPKGSGYDDGVVTPPAPSEE